jgi:hypothetical protein
MLEHGCEGAGQKRGAGQRPTAFDRGRARGREEKEGAQGGGVRAWARCYVGVGEEAKRGAGVRHLVGQHGTGTASPGHVGAAGALRIGEAAGASDAGAVADKWGWATSDPVTKGGV